MNQWIALTAELEETKEAIAKIIFKYFKAGKIHNDYALEQCRKLDELYTDAKNYENELADDFRGYTDGGGEKKGNVATKATAHAANFLSRIYIWHNVTAYKRHFRDQYMDLGTKAINSMEDGTALCDDQQCLKLCKYAIKLQKDANMRWEEIEILNRNSVKGNAFISAVSQFFTNLAIWGRSNGIPFLQKYVKVDEGAAKKFREEYRKKFQGTPVPAQDTKK